MDHGEQSFIFTTLTNFFCQYLLLILFFSTYIFIMFMFSF